MGFGLGLMLGNVAGGAAQGYDAGTQAAISQNALSDQIAQQNYIQQHMADVTQAPQTIQVGGTPPAASAPAAPAPSTPLATPPAPPAGLPAPDGGLNFAGTATPSPLLGNSAPASSPADAVPTPVASAPLAALAPPAASASPAGLPSSGADWPTANINVPGQVDNTALYNMAAQASLRGNNLNAAAQFAQLAQNEPIKQFQLGVSKAYSAYVNSGNADALAKNMADTYNTNVHNGQYMDARAVDIPVTGPNGQPVLGPDGKPQMQTQIQSRIYDAATGQMTPARLIPVQSFIEDAFKLTNPQAYAEISKSTIAANSAYQVAQLNAAKDRYKVTATPGKDGETFITLHDPVTGQIIIKNAADATSGAPGGASGAGGRDPVLTNQLVQDKNEQDAHAAVKEAFGGSQMNGIDTKQATQYAAADTYLSNIMQGAKTLPLATPFRGQLLRRGLPNEVAFHLSQVDSAAPADQLTEAVKKGFEPVAGADGKPTLKFPIMTKNGQPTGWMGVKFKGSVIPIQPMGAAPETPAAPPAPATGLPPAPGVH